MIDDDTARSIRDIRRNLRMTQEEFARALGITIATVCRWENGHAKPTKLATRAIERLAMKHEDDDRCLFCGAPVEKDEMERCSKHRGM